MNWFELEIRFLISELPDLIADRLENKRISLYKKTLELRLDNAEEAIALRDLLHPAIAQLVKKNPGKYQIDHVAYIWNGGRFKIPLFLPSLRKPATST